jgi:hypothetical protein
MPEKGQSPYPDMPGIHIGEAGVLKLLNNINSHKDTGPDGIPARLLHEYSRYLSTDIIPDVRMISFNCTGFQER